MTFNDQDQKDREAMQKIGFDVVKLYQTLTPYQAVFLSTNLTVGLIGLSAPSFESFQRMVDNAVKMMQEMRDDESVYNDLKKSGHVVQ